MGVGSTWRVGEITHVTKWYFWVRIVFFFHLQNGLQTGSFLAGGGGGEVEAARGEGEQEEV